ncbi:hypothetical protein E8E11_005010 [Didymella keratinophila]|nr:hypothetical protein E8E11_005010 [Didymella keratinophila]
MLQSSLSGWLKKPAASKENTQPPPAPPQASAAPKRPPPPPKSISAPPRMPLNRAPSSTTPMPRTTEQWNDIPEDFLSAPSSRPRSKKSPRPSAVNTPSSISRVPTPVGLSASTPQTATKTPSTAASTPPVAQNEPSIPNLFSLCPLPPNVSLSSLTPEHLDAYKNLNALTLPIPYPESFYKETMTEPHHSITLLALWTPLLPTTTKSTHAQDSDSGEVGKGQVVGAIRCRLLPELQLYISTIGVLAPYREHGIAVHLLSAVVRKAVELHGVRCVTAHVWEANEEGLEWYKKRKFEILGKEEGYYRKLEPKAAWLVRRWIGVGDLLGGEGEK